MGGGSSKTKAKAALLLIVPGTETAVIPIDKVDQPPDRTQSKPTATASGTASINPDSASIKIDNADGNFVTVSWGNIPNPSTSDYVTISIVNSTAADYITYAYNADGSSETTFLKINVTEIGLVPDKSYEVRYVSATGDVITTSKTNFNGNNANSTDKILIDTSSLVLPKGIVEFKDSIDHVPIPPTVIAWVDQMPTTQSKIEQSTTYLTGCIDVQITAYATSDPTSSELPKLLQQKSNILLYIKLLKKMPEENKSCIPAQAAIEQYYNTQQERTSIVITGILVYKPTGPYDAIILKRLNEVVNLCLGDLAPSRLKNILLKDEQFITTELNEQLKNCGTGHSSEDKTKHQQILDIMKVRQDIGGQGGYIALALKICVCYMNWEIFQTRTNGIFLEIIEETLTDPEQNDSFKWRETNSAVLLLCSHLSSYTVDKSKSTSFLECKALVTKHMEEITSELQLHENLMRTSGELGMLGALTIVNNQIGDSRIKQNDDNILGQHPMYLEYKKEYNTIETLIYNFPYFTNLPISMFDKYDKDIKQMALYMADACHTAVQWDSCVSKDQKLCTINVQPYIFLLLICARKINTSFHRKIKKLVGGKRYGNGDPTQARIKGFARMKEKQEEKYTSTKYGMPSSGVMCDIVRCLVTCNNPNDLKETFELIVENFICVRVKNGFAEKFVPFGFRQILINVQYTCPTSKLTMICEIQLNLKSYVGVKHRIHRLYSVVRCEDNYAFQPDLYIQLIKKSYPF